MQVSRAVVRVCLTTMLTCLPMHGPYAQRNSSDDFLLINVRVFDGATVLDRTQVAVVGGTIRAVGDDLREWPQLRTVDGSGATLLPGFIDAHVHVREADELRQALRFGVTTVLDMGAVVEPRALFALREEARLASDMADLRLAGLFAWSPASAAAMAGAPHMSITVPPVATVEQARQFAAARHADGADHLKIGLSGVRSAAMGEPNMEEPVARALVQTAHANGMLVVAHVETLGDADIALAAGVDGFAHVWRRGGANPEVARRIAERGVFVMPTLIPPDGFLPEGRATLLADPRFAGVLSETIKAHLGRSHSPPPGASAATDLRANLDDMIAAVRGLHGAGAKLLVATDANRDSPGAFGISLHRELELLHEAGLSPTETLAAATANTADAFGLKDRGSIVPGRRADMVLVRGDPTSDILATRDILRVWKAGVETDRSSPFFGTATSAGAPHDVNVGLRSNF